MKTSSRYFSKDRKVVSDLSQDDTGAKLLLKGRGIRRLKCRMVEESSAGSKEEPDEERTIPKTQGSPDVHCGLGKPKVTGGMKINHE